jgi:hypothetical protein
MINQEIISTERSLGIGNVCLLQTYCALGKRSDSSGAEAASGLAAELYALTPVESLVCCRERPRTSDVREP